MTKRIAERFVLADVRISAAGIQILSEYRGPISANFEVSIEQRRPIEPPKGAIAANETTVQLTVTTAKVDDGEQSTDPVFNAKVRVEGAFVLPEGQEPAPQDLSSCHHTFARMIFPLARSELGRMLSRARLQDVPLIWDLGPEDEEGSVSFGQFAQGEVVFQKGEFEKK